MPSNNYSNYKDGKRLKQHPLSYPFILAHRPEFLMYHVYYYYGTKANLSEQHQQIIQQHVLRKSSLRCHEFAELLNPNLFIFWRVEHGLSCTAQLHLPASSCAQICAPAQVQPWDRSPSHSWTDQRTLRHAGQPWDAFSLFCAGIKKPR